MRIYAAIVSLVVTLLLASCATEKQTTVAQWPDSEVFMLPQEAGFQWETLELKDGRFRYWFSSDVVARHAPTSPIEGTYASRGDQLILSTGKTYTLRPLNGVRSLWMASAIDHWNQFQVIDVYGILLPVESINSKKSALQPLFTKEQWDRSRNHVTKIEGNPWKWKQEAYSN